MREFFDQFDQVLKVKNNPKLRIRSFRIGCWILVGSSEQKLTCKSLIETIQVLRQHFFGFFWWRKFIKNKIYRFVVWFDEPITYFEFKIFVNRMSKLEIMLELVGLLTLVWIVNFVIMAKRSFAWMETWKQPLVNFCMAGSKLIMENIHMEVNLTNVVVI